MFRFYLPLAHITARQHSHQSADADLAVQAAELGLANAVLAWRYPDSRAFTAFARVAIIAQIRRTQDAGDWVSGLPCRPNPPHHTPVPI